MSFNYVNYKKIIKFIVNYKKINQNIKFSSIIAVTKTQPENIILEAINAGITVFGENRVQEAVRKYTNIRMNHKNIQLHMIGPLQTNKVKIAVEIFDFIHTLDRENLAREFVKYISTPFFSKKCFFIQINSGAEQQKSGIHLNEADAFIKYCIRDLKLNIIGLMCIPPIHDSPAIHFKILKKLALRNNLQHLSMGMSHDYKIAIKNGATFIRIGSKLFGERQEMK